MQQAQLGLFVAAMVALVVCGCIFAETKKKATTRSLRQVVPDEHQPGCFALEEERGENWKGSGGTVPSVKEAKPSL